MNSNQWFYIQRWAKNRREREQREKQKINTEGKQDAVIVDK